LSQRLNPHWSKKPRQWPKRPLLLLKKLRQPKRLPQKRNIFLSFPRKRESMVWHVGVC
jgi:hypothetical protein